MTLVNFDFSRLQTSLGLGLESRVGNTPLVPLRRVIHSTAASTSSAQRLRPGPGLPLSIQVLAKAEWFNPGGSIKDRPALNIIRAALETGKLTPGKRLLDSTSGNMGIAYATFGAALGIPVTLTLPGNASLERINTLRAFGAELVLTDPLEGSDGAILEARRLAAAHPDLYWYANQYDNPANWQAHYLTTGPEIWQQTDGQVTHFVVGLGTSGTLMGVGRYLRAMNPEVQIIAAQPEGPFHGLEGLKHMDTAIKPGIYDPGFPNRIIPVRTEEAHEMVRRLAREEGLFAGISSGAAVVAALKVASELEAGVVVTVFPDAGYKYLSDKSLWEK